MSKGGTTERAIARFEAEGVKAPSSPVPWIAVTAPSKWVNNSVRIKASCFWKPCNF
jgi:hypothetical protein